MTPGEIRGKTLSELRRARKDMMSAEWLASVRDLPEADRTAAATALLDVCLAIRRLENARVTAIRAELVDNGASCKTPRVRGFCRRGVVPCMLWLEAKLQHRRSGGNAPCRWCPL